jgi:hypothetical protein
MALQLAQEEPEAGPWRVELLSTVVNAVTRRGPDRSSSGRPAVLAVDGRSNNGKTTLAARIREMVPRSVVIHTDDIAWEHSRFGWADLLIDGILVPAHQGQAVNYRPPRWDEYGREGFIEVPVGCPLLIIEGDGAGRREVAHLIDTVIWVQADEREAGRRAVVRAANPPAADLANMAADELPFDYDGWMAEEIPFNTVQRTWERAHIIVCGTPEIPHDPSTEIVIASPPVISATGGSRPRSRSQGFGTPRVTEPAVLRTLPCARPARRIPPDPVPGGPDPQPIYRCTAGSPQLPGLGCRQPAYGWKCGCPSPTRRGTVPSGQNLSNKARLTEPVLHWGLAVIGSGGRG